MYDMGFIKIETLHKFSLYENFDKKKVFFNKKLKY